jgi:hypothetical protein
MTSAKNPTGFSGGSVNSTPIIQIDTFCRMHNKAVRYEKGYFYFIKDDYNVKN